DIKGVLQKILFEFPMKEAAIELPRWVVSLNKNHWLKRAVFQSIKDSAATVQKIGEISSIGDKLIGCEYISKSSVDRIDLGKGLASISIALQPQLFYQILGEVTGLTLESEEALMPCMIELAACKREYDKLKGALDEVQATGYGIVMPSMEELTLEEPEIVKQGGKYGVKLRASAPSIHMMRADITTEVNPIVGSEKQSEELVMYLLKEFEENPKKIWESNIFGKSLHELVNEGLHNKLYRMPTDARMKLQETIERIINEGCNGLVCLIL
ncbi:MAG: stage IV sporulation protein A, partial [Oscillospiraceae bacterium]